VSELSVFSLVVEDPESSLSLLLTEVDGKSKLLEHNKKMLALTFLTAGLTENNRRHFKIYSVLLPIGTAALAIKVICRHGGGFRH